jgi:hypothetical protein
MTRNDDNIKTPNNSNFLKLSSSHYRSKSQSAVDKDKDLFFSSTTSSSLLSLTQSSVRSYSPSAKLTLGQKNYIIYQKNLEDKRKLKEYMEQRELKKNWIKRKAKEDENGRKNFDLENDPSYRYFINALTPKSSQRESCDMERSMSPGVTTSSFSFINTPNRNYNNPNMRTVSCSPSSKSFGALADMSFVSSPLRSVDKVVDNTNFLSHNSDKEMLCSIPSSPSPGVYISPPSLYHSSSKSSYGSSTFLTPVSSPPMTFKQYQDAETKMNDMFGIESFQNIDNVSRNNKCNIEEKFNKIITEILEESDDN